MDSSIVQVDEAKVRQFLLLLVIHVNDTGIPQFSIKLS